ncbi:MAG TPA: YfiR family protein [Gammaproteobacteria bacterium]|nr:YfiR family protein [Gammaproteobacteria bacterium]
MAARRLSRLLASLRARGLAAAACVACVAAGVAWAQVRDTAPVSASSVKAAFLYKFAGYVEWPESAAAADEPITIGVAGAEPFAAELAEITRGRTVAGRPINVRRVAADDSFDGLQILFISNQARGSARGLLANARSRPILTVTESAGALADGSIINFTQDKDRVRFEISLYAAEQSMLKLNSRLLAVADSVHRGPE